MTHSMDEMLTMLQKYLVFDLTDHFQNVRFRDKNNLIQVMKDIYAKTNRSFVILIDEWDCLFREYQQNQDAQKKYLDFLRAWLKDKDYVALAYMTGILPIKKYGSHSALNMFTEYSMTDPGDLGGYFGFTEDEVKALMMLLQNYLDEYSKRADTENIRVKILGDITALSEGMQKSIKRCMERTKDNTGVTFNIALNYGGRAEIVRAAKEIAKEVENKTISLEDINEDLLESKLYTAGQPDPDLVIRTSGEMRTSNFLPWQIAYSEFLFVSKNWPDFNEEDLDNAIIEYQKRTRRLGK